MRVRPWHWAVAGLLALGVAGWWYIGLANTTHPAQWPMGGGGPARRYTGNFTLPAAAPSVLWVYPLNVDRVQVPTIAVGEDQVLFVASGSELFAIGPDGKRRWVWRSNMVLHSVALSRSGDVYVQGAEKLFALTREGHLKWEAPLAGRPAGELLVGRGGVVYAFSYPYLFAHSDDGKLKWRLETGRMDAAPAEGPDGDIFVAMDDELLAIDHKADVRWRKRLERPAAVRSLAVGPDGTIYLRSARRLYAVNDRGDLVTTTDVTAVPGANLAVGMNFLQDGAIRRDKSGNLAWEAGIGAGNTAWAASLVDADGNALLYTLSVVSRVDRTGQSPLGVVTLVDTKGQTVWQLQGVTATGLPAGAGQGRICFLGSVAATNSRGLICVGRP